MIQKHEIEQLGKTDATQCLVVGNHVFDPFIFQPSLVKFSRRQYLFLQSYRLGTSFTDACTKADMAPDEAERFLKKPATVSWLKDRVEQDHIRNEWAEPSKWWAKGQEFLENDDIPKHKVDVWKEFGDRVVPKQSRNAESGTTKIEITIDPGAIERSKERRASIEAQIVKEESAS